MCCRDRLDCRDCQLQASPRRGICLHHLRQVCPLQVLD